MSMIHIAKQQAGANVDSDSVRILSVRFIAKLDFDGELAQQLRRDIGLLGARLLRIGVRFPEQSEDENYGAISDQQWHAEFAELNADALEGPLSFNADALLGRNLESLGDLLGLTPVERSITHLFVLLKQQRVLSELASKTGHLTTQDTVESIASLLGLASDEVEAMINRRDNTLAGALLKISPELSCLQRKVQLITGLTATLTAPCRSPIDFLGRHFERVSPRELAADDFPHHAADLKFATGLFRGWRHRRQVGCNVLIYGPPGTGKTEFAKVIADAAGVQLIADAPEEGSERLDCLRFAQRVLSRGGDSALLVDEADDIVGTPLSRETGNGTQKYLLTRVLDESPIPTIWVTNHLYRFEPALLRRFAFVVEMRVPPRSVRGRILDRYLGNLDVPSSTRERWIANDALPPAIFASAARSVGLYRAANAGASGDGEAGAMASRVIENTAGALDIDLAGSSAAGIGNYRPEAINADRDLDALVQAMRAMQSARLCLYGPPGTGKTAFARHLADSIDRPLVVRRASDLFSRWLGGTEQNIAKAFAEARADKAVLLLDEADSFLTDRAAAERSWEVTQVNELLTQLEAFDGIFVAATNRVDKLDPASLRRFDFKIHFQPLRYEQATVLLADLAHDCGFVSGELRPTESALASLTPGDFANVRRQVRMMRPESPARLLVLLAAEVSARANPAGKIGFL